MVSAKKYLVTYLDDFDEYIAFDDLQNARHYARANGCKVWVRNGNEWQIVYDYSDEI